MAAWEVAVVLGVVAVTVYLFVREVLPVPITAMLAAALLMVIPARSWAGPILSPAEGLSGFSSTATVTVMMMFVLSAGIERSGAVAYLSQFLTRWAGKSLRRQTLSVGAVAGPISGFVNNTPVVAVMIPVVSRLAQHGGHNPSRLLMPLSFFAMLGGTLTIIGTSTNLLGNALLPQFGLEPFGFFEFTLVGVIALLVAALYFLTVGVLLVPDRGDGTAVDRFDLKGFMGEFEVAGDSDAVGKSLKDLGLNRREGIQVVRVFREDRVIASPRQPFTLNAGDVLLVQASRERLEKIPSDKGLRTLAELKHGIEDTEEEDGRDARVATAELVIAPGSNLAGKTLDEIRFRDRFDALVLAVRHGDRVAIGSVSQTRLSAGDVLLAQAHPDALARLEQSSMFFLTREREKEVFHKDKIALSLLILTGVVVASALGLTPIVTASIAGAVLMVLTGCLKMPEFLSSIQWNVILMLAGVIPLGVALQKSGAAGLLASGVTVVGNYVPAIVFLMLVFLVTSLITETISNNASVVLLVPIMVSAATTLGLDGRPFVLAVMLSASTSMLTPVGYQTNTMVYAPGNYRFSDYIRVGGLLNLILVIVIPLVIAWMFPLQ